MHHERRWADSKSRRIYGQSSRQGNHARQFTWSVSRVGLKVDVGVYAFFGNEDWIKGAIEKSSLICATDGSYIKEMVPDLCLTAFILECNEGTGRIVGSFPESSTYGCQCIQGQAIGPDGDTLDTVGSKQGLAKIRRQGEDLLRLLGAPAEDHITAPCTGSHPWHSD